MISHAQIEKQFGIILPLLPKQDFDALRQCWKNRDLPIIITEPKLIDSSLFTQGTRQASSMLGIHFYRLDKIQEKEIDGIILHEIAHDLFFFTKKHDYHRYCFSPDDGYRSLVEFEVMEQVSKWVGYIRDNKKGME